MKKNIVYLPAAILFLASGSANRALARDPAEAKSAPQATVVRAPLGKAETISGSLTTLVKDQRLVVLQGTGLVSYSFKVTTATKIRIGEKEAAFDDLSALANNRCSITFVPMREGNLAKKIQIEQ